jgi:tellurite resistance protein
MTATSDHLAAATAAQSATTSSAPPAAIPAAEQAAAAATPLLARLPVTLFASVMGLTGLALAWHRVDRSVPFAGEVGASILVLATLLFCGLLVVYGAKLLQHGDAVAAEWQHPIRIALFPALSISLLLLATGWLPFARPLAEGLWLLGAALHLVLMLAIVHAWIARPLEWQHATPAWFIPAVGNVIAPVAGARLGYTEVSWFFFATGLGFWLVLLPIVFARLLFAGPLPERLRPMLFVLIPPPAVGFLSYLALGGTLDPLARVLYGLALFFTLFVLARALWFARIGFALSWWAYSFPLAAITIATLTMAERTGLAFYRVTGGLLLMVATAVIAVIAWRTVAAFARRDFAFLE